MMFRLLSVLLPISILVGCSVSEPKDGGPRKPVDVSHIPDAVPAPVVRTRAGNAQRYTVLGRTYETLTDSRGYRAKGTASWYGTKFHGRKTANGETYNMYAMTAAHKTLPIPSYVRVTNLNNRRSVIVRINDRGPFHGDRLIDLSYAAARKLGIDATGTGQVSIEDVTPHPDQVQISTVSDKPQPGLYLQVGAFSDEQGATRMQNRVNQIVTEPVSVYSGEDRMHRVKIGPLASEWHLVRLQEQLRQSGLGAGHPVRIE